MGCCVSTKKPTPSPEFHSSRTPPPVDEETVKEVLSETPNPNPFIKIQDRPINLTPKKIRPTIQYPHINRHDQNPLSGKLSCEVFGEICSNLSESVSAITVEEDDDVFRRKSSPAKLRHRNQQLSGELRAVRNSPVRGKPQSPVRVRSGSDGNTRGVGFGSTGRQRPVPGNGHVSRSRSPANRTVVRGGGGGGGGVRNGVGKSPSARKTENSPGRVVQKRLPEMTRKPELSPGLESEEGRWGPSPSDGNEDESLDNPLVSLECFIFL